MREKKNFYIFSASFPLCTSILKESIIGSPNLNLNFFEERLIELRENLKKSDINQKMRGIIYEESIHATIQDLQKRNQIWEFKMISQKKLKNILKKDQVIKTSNFFFNFLDPYHWESSD